MSVAVFIELQVCVRGEHLEGRKKQKEAMKSHRRAGHLETGIRSAAHLTPPRPVQGCVHEAIQSCGAAWTHSSEQNGEGEQTKKN
jgi:hypothetical protein